MMTPDELIAFERDIADLFEQGQIRAPVHLHGGNESQLIEIFKNIKPGDWVFSTHRSHYHALLKGVPPELVKAEILKGNSICLKFPEHKFYTSAIVGGIIPIALGVATAGEKVWVFIGEMAAHTGIYHDCEQWACGHNLPVSFVIEDNGVSVETPTCPLWGCQRKHPNTDILNYYYRRTYPHQGSGKWVTF